MNDLVQYWRAEGQHELVARALGDTTTADYAAMANRTADVIEQLRASLKEMVDCYWGKGDGEPPPSFVQRAIDLTKEKSHERAV